MSDEKTSKGAMTRIAEFVGIPAAIVATVVGLWTLFHRESTDVPDYQRQVLATCQQIHKILSVDHNEILVIDPQISGNSPEDMFRVRKNVLLQVLNGNLKQAETAFDVLNEKAVPTALAAQHRDAVDAQATWRSDIENVIAKVRKELPDNATLGRLRQLGVDMGGGSATASVKLNGAMTALAGENCQVTS
jgi:hypothetical protein